MVEDIGQVNVIRHLMFEDLGSFEEVLDDMGFRIHYVEAATASRDELALVLSNDPSPLIILGGPISVNDVGDFAFLQIEIDMLKVRIANDWPTLGICLGAQLIARAARAAVYPGERKEIGWFPITLTEAGEATPLAALDGSVFHWHGETFDLPPGAVHLASSERFENQAFSLGERILAVQFHPEVTIFGLEHWYIGHTGEIAASDNLSVDGLRQDASRYGVALQKAGSLFLKAWMEAVAGSGGR